ncbi:MAG: hypothetical protein QOE01_1836 [Actinomycetota bacterium]|jgi:hypothetical protein|nr:hypothetical protein [Actinomycetota bacterium]
MIRSRRARTYQTAALGVAALVAGLVAPSALTPGTALAGSGTGQATADGLATSPGELTETSRLADRRSLVTGDRAYAMSTADSLYPAAGWHIRGEMGGIWTPPIKLVDGIWFRLADHWLGDASQAPATSTNVGWGYTRTTYSRVSRVAVSRTDFVPDGIRATVVGLTLTSPVSKILPLAMDAHSELMSVYPWGWTSPNAATFNLPDSGSYDNGSLLFRDQGTPPVTNASAHDWSAFVGGQTAAAAHQLGPDYRGPEDPAVICPTDGTPPQRCDDTAFGKGTGGQLRWNVRLRAGQPTTLWFAVAGSDDGVAAARQQYAAALADPAALLAQKVAHREDIESQTQVSLPGDPLLQHSVTWSKQMLASSVQEAHDLKLRPSHEGSQYPASLATVATARWIGAGFPDYPWLFGTDGEYTTFAAVAAGQFSDIEAHLRALRDVSTIVNNGSGKVAHEATSDGQVYYGTNDSAGNTDETAKFPSAVAEVWRWTGDNAFRDEMYSFAKSNMHYVVDQLDADHDGWPEGLGNVERNGMGVEKLDNTVYTIRGLRDLADMATSKGDTATASWASSRAAAMESAFEGAWWYGGDTNQYADSIDYPSNPANDNTKIFQRHWIGLTPMEAELVRPGQVTRPLASDLHGQEGIAQRQMSCYSGTYGLYHTGTGPTSADGGNKGDACDTAVSSVQSERSIFSLTTSIMSVAEGNFGRMGSAQQQRYTDANATIQLDPNVWEMPGAMPEIAPSPDFTANIDQKLTDRSMVMQAWGAYGVLWPVVHQQLGVSPDIGRGDVSVVPQIPDGQDRISGSGIRLGAGSIDVAAHRTATTLTTEVTRHVGVHLTIGHVLPGAATVGAVTLDGVPVTYQVQGTAHGRQVVVDAGTASSGTDTLVVTLT